jgi:hypothetical protein
MLVLLCPARLVLLQVLTHPLRLRASAARLLLLSPRLGPRGPRLLAGQRSARSASVSQKRFLLRHRRVLILQIQTDERWLSRLWSASYRMRRLALCSSLVSQSCRVRVQPNFSDVIKQLSLSVESLSLSEPIQAKPESCQRWIRLVCFARHFSTALGLLLIAWLSEQSAVSASDSASTCLRKLRLACEAAIWGFAV